MAYLVSTKGAVGLRGVWSISVIRSTEDGYYNQTIRDESRLRIPKDRQEGRIPGLWDA
jgi:hypothetical protein